MKNHFFFSYAGNKRQEVEHIYNNINLEGIDTIVEPFCGSCAVSYYIWTQNKDKNYKYILNDLDDKLIELLRIIKKGEYKEIQDDVNRKREEILTYEDDKETAKNIYNNYIKNEKINGYILAHKYYTIRAGLFPMDLNYRMKKEFNLTSSPIFEFLTTANIELFNTDGNKIINDYNNEKSFIFLDPPYIASCNKFYSNDSNENTNNIYEFLLSKGLNNFKSKMLICHENNWLFKIIFKDYIDGEIEYEKIYQNKKKKKTTHICIKNY
jgi:site-specific DNA-adenine methylase